MFQALHICVAVSHSTVSRHCTISQTQSDENIILLKDCGKYVHIVRLMYRIGHWMGQGENLHAGKLQKNLLQLQW